MLFLEGFLDGVVDGEEIVDVVVEGVNVRAFEMLCPLTNDFASECICCTVVFERNDDECRVIQSG